MRLSLWGAVLAAVLIPPSARAADKAGVDRAITTGIRALRSMQKKDGSWDFTNANSSPGATSLAGLALLECGADKDDPAVTAAAKYLRAHSVGLRWTYSISLVILFLDRLGDGGDEQLIESLAARLVAGQLPSGNWSYNCPDPVVVDQLVARQAIAEAARPRAGQGGSRPAGGDGQNKNLNFLRRVALLRQQVAPNARGDNSNTQFAILALWVCRRHGLPVERSLSAVVRHFRETQVADGEWMYDDKGIYGGPSATMTCAGLLAMSVARGLVSAKQNTTNEDPDKNGPAAPEAGRGAAGINARPRPAGEGLTDEQRLKAGLLALSRTIGLALGQLPESPPEQGGVKIPASRGGRSFFLIWSVGRTAVALGLNTIGDKDWYDWGADILLANQSADGKWEGSYAMGGVDTSFALLFLKRANLLDDLTKLAGRLQDPGQRVLRSGGSGTSDLLRGRGGSEEGRSGETPGTGRSPKAGPAPGDSPADKLAAALVELPPAKQEAEIERLRDQRGAVHTEALATAIPFLGPDSRRKARTALAERESRMRVETIGRDLNDDSPEIRAAAARACALKESKGKEVRDLIPRLIGLLTDPEGVVFRAAHSALKELTGEDFGPASSANEAERKRAAELWQAWWKKQSR